MSGARSLVGRFGKAAPSAVLVGSRWHYITTQGDRLTLSAAVRIERHEANIYLSNVRPPKKQRLTKDVILRNPMTPS